LAAYPFVERAELKITQAIVEAIAAADLGGPFVVDARQDLSAIGQENRTRSTRPVDIELEIIIAVAVDAFMELVGGDRREPPVLVRSRRTVGITVRTVGAAVAADVTRYRTAGVGEIAAAAARRRAVALK